MVLGVVSSEGDVMPPHFFPQGLKSNKGPTGGGGALDESCGWGQEIHLPTRFSTCSQGQGGSVLAAGECAPLLACGCLAPQQPQHEPLWLLFVGEGWGEYLCHQPQECGLPEVQHQEVHGQPRARRGCKGLQSLWGPFGGHVGGWGGAHWVIKWLNIIQGDSIDKSKVMMNFPLSGFIVTTL